LPAEQTDEQNATLRGELAQLADGMTQARPEDRPSTITTVRQRLEVLSKRNEITTVKSVSTNHYRVGAWLLGLILVSALATYFYQANQVSTRPGYASTTNGGQALQPRTPFKLKMVDVPAGEFVMGGVSGDEAVRAEELPSRTIVFSRSFRISACEITVGQFREFVEATGYKTEAERSGEGGWLVSRSSSFGKLDPSFIWSNPGYPVSDNLPVTMVSYDDAVAFCEWLSERDKKMYRLPTEAEWEYCCRAGTTEVHSFPIAKINEYVWSLDTAGKNVFRDPLERGKRMRGESTTWLGMSVNGVWIGTWRPLIKQTLDGFLPVQRLAKNAWFEGAPTMIVTDFFVHPIEGIGHPKPWSETRDSGW